MADNPKKRDRLSLSERQSRGLVAPEDLCYTAMAGEVSLDEDAWTELEKRIKLRLGSDSRAALTRALNDLLENIALRKEIPPSLEVRKDLERIGKHAKGLAELIGRRDRDAAAQIAVHPVVGYDTSKFVRDLRQISTNAQAFKFSKPTGRPHRDRNQPLRNESRKSGRKRPGKKSMALTGMNTGEGSEAMLLRSLGRSIGRRRIRITSIPTRCPRSWKP